MTSGGQGDETDQREQRGALCLDCSHRAVWHHDERGCQYNGNGRHGCPCALDSDEVVAALIRACRPQTAPMCHWRELHQREPDDRIPNGCGWRTLHEFIPARTVVQTEPGELRCRPEGAEPSPEDQPKFRTVDDRLLELAVLLEEPLRRRMVQLLQLARVGTPAP